MENAAAMKKMPCIKITGDHAALCVHVCRCTYLSAGMSTGMLLCACRGADRRC